jgi:hypothetical protein
MILAVLLTLAFTLGGACLSYYYDKDAPLIFRLCSGAVVGMAVFAVVAFWLAILVGFGAVSIGLAALISAAPLITLHHAVIRERVLADVRSAGAAMGQFIHKPRAGQIGTLSVVAFLLVIFWVFFGRAMIVKPEGLFTGVTNNLGDLPFHLSVITGFTEGNNFPPQDPSYAGARFAYPLLADFVAAVFVRTGASWAGAMLLQNLILAVGLVGVLYRYTFQLTRDHVAAIIAPLLLLFSGGMGWLALFLRDGANGRGLTDLLGKLPHDYSILPNSVLRWGNALTSLLVTQRSLLFGMPLTILIFAQWWTFVSRGTETAGSAEDPQTPGKKGKKKPKRSGAGEVIDRNGSRAWLALLPAGLMAGLLPLIHAHSFAAVIAAGGALAILFRRDWRAWAVFLGSALLLALPQLLWITHGGSVETQSFLGFHFGWDNGLPDASGAGELLGTLLEPSRWAAFVLFWLKNTGIFIPLLMVAAIWTWRRGGNARLALLFYLPFIFFFIGPNLIKLAPWVWDNIKVLIYWFVASIPLVAGLLGYLWKRHRFAPAGVIAAVLVLTLSGALDVWRVVSGATEVQVMDAESVALAEQIRQKVPPRALMLNAPTYNTPVFLTGRRSYLGYTAHVWSHGINYEPRYRILAGIYAGEPGASGLIIQNGIEYVVVGPLERSMLQVNDGFFQQYPVVASMGASTVYRVTEVR